MSANLPLKTPSPMEVNLLQTYSPRYPQKVEKSLVFLRGQLSKPSARLRTDVRAEGEAEINHQVPGKQLEVGTYRNRRVAQKPSNGTGKNAATACPCLLPAPRNPHGKTHLSAQG